MSHIQQYRQIDFVKWIMACAIVLLHLPFDNLWISIIQQYISRLGVPIFFAFSGFFCYANLEANTKRNVMKKYISRIGKLYLFWGGIYFPLLYFSGDYSLKNLLKEYLFCAPAYLWYLPAVLIGCISLIFFYKNIKSFCAFMFLSGVLYIIGTLGNSLLAMFRDTYRHLSDVTNDEFTLSRACSFIGEIIYQIMIIAAPFFIVIFVSIVASMLLQVKWKVSFDPMKPDLKRFDPVSGMKRLFSKDKVVALIMSVAKLSVMFYIVYSYLNDKWNLVLDMHQYTLEQALALIGDIIINIGYNGRYQNLRVGGIAGVSRGAVRYCGGRLYLSEVEISSGYENVKAGSEG